MYEDDRGATRQPNGGIVFKPKGATLPARMPYHRGIPRVWHAHSCAKRPKPVFIVVLYVVDQMTSVAEAPASQAHVHRCVAGGSAPISANGHVVEDAYKPDTNPVQAKFHVCTLAG